MWDKFWQQVLKYTSSHIDLLTTVAWDVAKIVILFIASRIVTYVLVGTASRILHLRAVKMDERRRNTLTSLIHNTIRYTIYFVFILMSLQVLQFHIETLLAGAGIAGLAVGLGAQSVIKDVLTGFFILFEDQYGVGDYVTINGATGTITQIGVRLTRMQVWTGELESIPNGQIQQVTNYSRTNSLAIIDVGVNYSTDLDFAMGLLDKVMQELKESEPDLIGEVTIMGVQAFQADAVLIRATADCRSMTHFRVRREAQLMIKKVFDENGIDIPVPQRVIEIKPTGIPVMSDRVTSQKE